MACSDSRLEPISRHDVILAFGDSLTEGVGTDKATAYPAVLEELTGQGVINAGISGETTTEGLERFEQTLIDYQASLVILLEGGNDILRNLPASQTKDNLARMIKIAHQHDAQVLLVAVPQKKLFSDAAPFYLELAEEYQVPLEKSLLADLLRSPKYKSDPIHLNTAGYRKLAEGLYQRLIDEGAIDR
ncbi:arylesterase [Litoribrevibacter albus]|uniref:Arylesterase n=1 Tax=Litoribrevibacter albus TaxID=1473156 RepID=A0AA37WA96_9GAMM|nr:arylesterase [Litoribrevibacter albus]